MATRGRALESLGDELIRVIAHRGASADAPENTFAAFDLALEQGADWIETDLHLSRDGVAVVVHDADLARLGGRGRVLEHHYADLRALDAGAGERIPNVDELLDRLGSATFWNLELKIGPDGAYPGLEDVVWRAVSQRGLEERVLFSSFDRGVLFRLRRLAPRAKLGVLCASRAGWVGLYSARIFARMLRAEALHPARSLVSESRVRRAHRQGLSVYPYTADDPVEWARLVGAGVDGIFTNQPGELHAFLRDCS